MGGEKVLIIRERKTAINENAGKESVAETEHERIARIPPVVGVRPIVVQPETVVIGLQVEEVRVSVGVSFVRHIVRSTAHLIRFARKRSYCIVFMIENHPI